MKEDRRLWLVTAACGLVLVAVAAVGGGLSAVHFAEAIVGAMLTGVSGWRFGRSWPRNGP